MATPTDRNTRPAEDGDYPGLVADLGVAHRTRHALRVLIAAGEDAGEAVREGLCHPDPEVRLGCCKVLDHTLDEEALPELVANLTHPHAGVRLWAVHALACDRCKEGSCRPAENEVVPIAVRMLADDESRHVRQMVAGLLGNSVHRHPEALRALEHARDHDPDPAVRKVAGWNTPGGSRFRRTKPRGPDRRA